MNELIKRLERVIQTGVPDKDGQHPISAETVLEVVNELSEHGTNLASLGTDCISRQQAIDAVKKLSLGETDTTRLAMRIVDYLERLPSAQPEIIRCKDCKYITEHYDTDGNVPYWTCSEWDSGTDYDGFCHYAERRTDE